MKVNLFSSVNVLKLLEGNNTQGIYDLTDSWANAGARKS